MCVGARGKRSKYHYVFQPPRSGAGSWSSSSHLSDGPPGAQEVPATRAVDVAVTQNRSGRKQLRAQEVSTRGSLQLYASIVQSDQEIRCEVQASSPFRIRRLVGSSLLDMFWKNEEGTFFFSQKWQAKKIQQLLLIQEEGEPTFVHPGGGAPLQQPTASIPKTCVHSGQVLLFLDTTQVSFFFYP